LAATLIIILSLYRIAFSVETLVDKKKLDDTDPEVARETEVFEEILEVST